MTAKTHMAGGALCGAIAAYLMPQLVTDERINLGIKAGVILVAAYSSLLCDVDEKNSTIGRKLWFISWPVFILTSILQFLRFFLPKRSQLRKNLNSTIRKMQHRGMAHYPLNAVILAVLGLAIAWILTSAKLRIAGKLITVLFNSIALGLLSHILLDMISGKVPIFGPFKDKRYGIKLFKTGGFLERYLVKPGLMLGTILLVMKMGQQWMEKGNW